MARAKRKQQGTRRVDRERARLRLRRWAKFGLGGSALALLVAAFVTGLVPLPLPEREFPIHTLKVESTFEHVSREEVAAVVAPHAARGFFDTDVAAIRGELQAMPWVRSASVRRVWPDTLQVMLLEERAVARWAAGGLVNANGELFHPDIDASVDSARDGEEKLPVFTGPARSVAQVTDYYFALQRQLSPLGLRIERLAMDARRAWELTLDNGIRLTLGNRDAERQMQRFVRFYPQVMAARATDIAQIDLRYSNGFAVRWRTPAAQVAAGKNTGDAV